MAIVINKFSIGETGNSQKGHRTIKDLFSHDVTDKALADEVISCSGR